MFTVRKVVFLLIICFIHSVAFSSEIDNNDDYARITLQKKRRIESHILKYKAKINEIAVSIFNIDDKINWLNMKIEKIIDQKRDVPDDLKESILNLKLKKNVIVNELNRINKQLEARNKEILELGTKVKLLNGGEKPSWWPFSEEEKRQIEEHKNRLLIAKIGNLEKKSAEERMLASINIRKSKTRKSVVSNIKTLGLSEFIIFEEDKDFIILSNKLPILFGSGKKNIVKRYKDYIKKLSILLKKCSIKKIIIKGFSDANKHKKVRKFKTSSYRYGYLRAMSVAEEFVKNGINKSLINISSESDSFAKGKTKVQRSLDRKATIKIYIEK